MFHQKVLFKHCDLAGIVFYPRYFEMINDCVEAFFDTALDYPFEKLHLIGGMPTARIDATFTTPGRHADMLEIELSCLRLGRASLDLRFMARCMQSLRFKAESTIVFVNKEGKPEAWPLPLREALQQHLEVDNL